MKKALSVLLSILVICLSFTSVFASAKDLNNGEGMFEVSAQIEADAYMLVDLADGNVIAQKNKDKVKYPASLTKIATAMVTIENVNNLEDTVSVSEHAVNVLAGTDAQVAGLEPGDKVTYRQLLSLTMVHSACDACQVLAEAVGGSESGFVKMMNEWAEKCGCKNTHFVNPDGLHDDNHYTTAADMMLMTRQALKNDTFVQISTETFCKYKDVTFPHTNYMLHPENSSYYYEYAKGIKTGTTTQAGNCLITRADKGGKNYLAIIMDSPMIDDMKGSFIDAKELFEWAYNDLKQKQLYTTSDIIAKTNILYAKDSDKLALSVPENLNALVPITAEEKDFEVKLSGADEALEAPVKKGDIICKANIVYKGKTVAITTLVAAEDAKLNIFAKISATIKQGFSKNPVLNVICLIILLAVIILLIRIIRVRRIKKKRAAMRRARLARRTTFQNNVNNN